MMQMIMMMLLYVLQTATTVVVAVDVAFVAAAVSADVFLNEIFGEW